MKRHLLPVLAAALVYFGIMASPAFAQAEKGDKDIQVNGNLTIPHRSPGSAQAFGSFGMGYYASKKSRLGANITGSGGGGNGSFGVNASYDYFLSTKSPKLLPFVGGLMGVNVAFVGGAATSLFSTSGEFGFDYYFSKRTAVNTRYVLTYLPNGAGTAADKTNSMITMGFRFLF